MFARSNLTLPEHCEPSSQFLTTVSATFETCIPTPLALISTVLGIFSILSWLFAQVPQIIKNFQLHSTSGLSILFLMEWLLGDLSNLLGSLFTQQATWQVVLASYYCCVDCILVGQWLWYEHLRHGRVVKRIRLWRWTRGAEDGDDDETRRSRKKNKPKVLLDGVPIVHAHGPSKSKPIAAKGGVLAYDSADSAPSSWKPSSLFRMPQFQYSYSSAGSTLTDGPAPATQPRPIVRQTRPESPIPSPRTVLYITLLLAITANATPIYTSPTLAIASKLHPSTKSTIEYAGQIFSWMSTLLYLGSRLPQLVYNYTRRSTEGLSPTLFLAAFFGNLFYSSSLLTNPSLWEDLPPYGGGGWAGPEGSSRVPWATRAAPFFLGAAGVLVMDAAVGLQFLMYGSGSGDDQAKRVVLVVEEEGVRGVGRWRRVSGWMRGWVPKASERKKKNKDNLMPNGDGFETETDAETESLLSVGTPAGASTPRGDSGSMRNYGAIR